MENLVFGTEMMIVTCAVLLCIAVIHGVAMWLKKCRMDRFQKYGYGERPPQSSE